LATKSVSERSCTIDAAAPERPMATAPSEASRSARLAWLANPFSRSRVTALSRSPSVSSRAFLASSMPTPVIWRSFWTSLAEKAGTVRPPRSGRAGLPARRPGARPRWSLASGSGQSAQRVRPLLPVPVPVRPQLPVPVRPAVRAAAGWGLRWWRQLPAQAPGRRRPAARQENWGRWGPAPRQAQEAQASAGR
jgi:hypothetical protein